MYDKIRKLQDIEITDKTVIVRANFDVPLKDGEVLDNSRLQASLETIDYLVNLNCKVILIGHLGRPEGKIVDELSLMPVRFELGRLLNRSIKFAHIQACENSVKFMEKGEILMLENLRFHPGEESPNKKERVEFISKLASLADVFVNDCFGVYREHASTYDIAQLLPSYAGFSLQKEIDSLNYIKKNPVKPFVAIIGGVKADTKIPIMKALLGKIDTMIIGGAIAYTFLKASGVSIGKSKYEKEEVSEAEKILKLAKKNKCEIVLPIDHIVGEKFEEDAKPITIDAQKIPKDYIGMDVGPKTLELFASKIENAKTIIWDGPMGVFEWKNFSKGTETLGQYITLCTPKDAFKVAGGSETTLAINTMKIKAKRFSHISVGGGMMINYIAADKNEHFKVLDILVGTQKTPVFAK